MVLRFPSCSPRRSGFLVTVACGWFRKLDASVEAPGPHDFAVRRKRRSSESAARVHRIPPNVRDDGQRPSFGRDGRSCRSDLPDGLSQIFLQKRLDRLDMQLIDLPVGQISRPSRSDAEKSKTLLFSIVG